MTVTTVKQETKAEKRQRELLESQCPDPEPKRVCFTTDVSKATGFAGWAVMCPDFTTDPHLTEEDAVDHLAAISEFGTCPFDPDEHEIVRLYYARAGGRRPADDDEPAD